MSKPGPRPIPATTTEPGLIANGVMLASLALLLLAVGCVWIIPIEVLEQWAIDRAQSDPYAKLEAMGATDFLVWLGRIVLPVLVICVWRIWWRLDAWQRFALDVWRGFLALTEPAGKSGHPLSFTDRLRAFACRGLLLGWSLLFLGHSIHAIDQRAREWPYFWFESGNAILPNISPANRAVIRYLQKATPPTARILVASDQKLFFLSYYLRPRTLYHKMHPESEHVIPLKNQERKLAAFRLDELSAADLERIPHDYTVEYFEHPDMVNPSDVMSDRKWVEFLRHRDLNPTLVPSYLMRLRKVDP